MKTILVKYGIRQNFRGRYEIVVDGNAFYRLSYAKADFAMKKAQSFAKGLRKDFVNFLGEQIHFVFEASQQNSETPFPIFSRLQVWGLWV